MSGQHETIKKRIVEGRGFFCSWSGGKDSCLALYRVMREGGKPRCLVSMLEEDGSSSRGHGLPVEILCQQALSIGVPLVARATSWEGYESALLSILEELKGEGVEDGVFGDIELEEHREWLSRVCYGPGVEPHFPLWGMQRNDLLKKLFEAGFTATIVAVKEGVLDNRFLGRTLDSALLEEFEELGIDACGEEGEYHTVITDGPILSTPLFLKACDRVLKDGQWYLNVTL